MREQDGSTVLRLPEEPIDRLIEPFERFLHVEAAAGPADAVLVISAPSPLRGTRYMTLLTTRSA